jgi:signal transduction histidine kinase
MRRQLILDLGIAAAFAGAMVAEMALRSDNRTETTPLAIAVVVVAVLPTLTRHRHPAWSLVACMTLLYAVLAIVDVHYTAPFSSMLCGYSLALVVDRRRVVYAGLALVPAVVGAILLFSDDRTLLNAEIPKNLAFVAAPLLLGAAVRNRRDYLAALVDRAETAERTRDEEARRRVGEERLRIARDVHDVVAHAMVAINVQAGVGAHLLDRDPEQARRTLQDIEKVSSEALSDLRSTLGMLREDATGNDGAPVRPAQGLRELDELGESLRTAGIEVDLDVDPATATLPASVTSTGYRIVQEALTNVVRHAGGSHARVRVTRGADALVIEVDDDGGDEASAAPPGAGRVCAACASAPRPRAGRWRPVPRPAAAGASWRPCRRERHDDPGPGGRRPDAGPGRFPCTARLRGRHRGRRRGRRRGGRGRSGGRDPARRRAHGHPDAPP